MIISAAIKGKGNFLKCEKNFQYRGICNMEEGTAEYLISTVCLLLQILLQVITSLIINDLDDVNEVVIKSTNDI